MRIRLVLFCVVVLLTVCGQAFAGDPEGEIRARDYSLQGVRLGISVSEFEKQAPEARAVESIRKNAPLEYELELSAGRVARFAFRGGRLLAISVQYTFEGDDRVEREAGVGEELMREFGRPQRNEDAALGWSFPNVHRELTFSPSQSSVVFRIVDTSGWD